MYTEQEWYQALETLCDAGWTPKKLAALAMEHELHSSEDLDRVAKWVRDCLNPRRADQVFKPSQLLRLMEQTGNHGAFFFMAEVLGYTVQKKQNDGRVVERRQTAFWRQRDTGPSGSLLGAGRFKK